LANDGVVSSRKKRRLLNQHQKWAFSAFLRTGLAPGGSHHRPAAASRLHTTHLLFKVLSLCLSRACLGKMIVIVFSNVKMAPKKAFCAPWFTSGSSTFAPVHQKEKRTFL
jgi:hypothetical protein